MASPGRIIFIAFTLLCLIWTVVPGRKAAWTHGLVEKYHNLTFTPPPKEAVGNDLLIVYAYHESKEALDSARFFLKHGLHANADFIFIVNGISQFEREIPKNLPNVDFRLRDNDCYDLGAYGRILGQNDRELAKRYKKFILLNSSIRGPFLPVWSKDCWSDVYGDLITDTVKLGGMTFNCFQPHVQSMIFSTDQIGLNILLDHCLSTCANNMAEAVQCEIGTTNNMVSKGYKVDVLMTGWRGEYGDPDEYYDSCEEKHLLYNDDVLKNGGYFGFNVHPYETIFIKSNRDIDPAMIHKMEEWHGKMNYSSWDACGKR